MNPSIKARTVETPVSPEEVAALIWDMDDSQQADMFAALLEVAGGSHRLMLQFLGCRDTCASRDDKSLEAFQYMFASAYKYFS